MFRWRALPAVLALLVGATACAVAPVAVAVPSAPCSPTVSITGFSDALDGARYGARRIRPVTGLSGLAVDRDGRLLALGDRSVLFTLDPRSREPLGAVSLSDEHGRPLDAEGLAVDTDGTRLVASETEPSVRRFDERGRLIGRLDVPPDLAARAERNTTLEGVAVLAPGGPVVGAMEGALAGDDPGVRRFPTWPGPTWPGPTWPGPTWAYRPDPALDVSEIAATGDGRLLVVERSFTSGVGNSVHLALADPRGETLVRTPLADLGACPTLGATAQQAQTNPLLDNIEGMTVLRRDPDGALRVLLVSDDNQNSEQTTRLYDLLVRLPGA